MPDLAFYATHDRVKFNRVKGKTTHLMCTERCVVGRRAPSLLTTLGIDEFRRDCLANQFLNRAKSAASEHELCHNRLRLGHG